MDNVVVGCLGDIKCSDFYNSLKDLCNPVIFEDSSFLKINTDNQTNTYIADVESRDRLTELISEIMPVRDIFIFSKLVLEDDDNIKLKLDELLTKIFLFIKYMYAPLMRQRKGKVWIMEPEIEYSKKNISEVIPLIDGFKAGIKCLTKIAAMELAKKNIVFNYISGETSVQKIKIILEWSLNNQNIYLTAQELTI